MIRTYKRKLILTKAQEKRILSWLGTCRMIYNMGLDIRISAWRNKQENVDKYELMRQVTSIRDIEWIKDVNADCLQLVVKRLDKSYKSFFKGGGFPKFASKRTFRSIQFKNIVEVKNRLIRLPSIGWLKTFNDTEIIGTPKTATIIKEPTGFFICIQCDNVPAKFESENQTIGLDMGLSHFCVDSNGCFIENPKHFKKYERQLRVENRSLARKKKGSNSWKKQAAKLALLHHKIGNVRRDFLHKESTKIAKLYHTVYMEDLNIQGMVKNRNLSKHILDAGWGMFKTMLEYKTTVVKVDPKYTSQQCNQCGHISKDNRKSQSQFECVKCGHKDNADINASHNIKSKGITLSRERSSIEQALALESINTDMSVIMDKHQ